MSYILEALKKAQAERQIGSTPTSHAPTLAGVAPGPVRAPRRAPVIVAMVLMGAAIAGLATMLVRQQPAASQQASAPTGGVPASEPSTAPTAGPALPSAPASGSAPASPAASAPVAAAVAPAAAPPATAAPSAIEAPVIAAAPVATAPVAAPATTGREARAASSVAARAAEVAPAPSPAAPPAAAPVEEQIQTMQDLPEPIQRAIPQITLGGYMYSRNPADRLLLIDKVLRREGEEVAPGLLLEKLQPKQAVFSFRGYRYRVQL